MRASSVVRGNVFVSAPAAGAIVCGAVLAYFLSAVFIVQAVILRPENVSIVIVSNFCVVFIVFQPNVFDYVNLWACAVYLSRK